MSEQKQGYQTDTDAEPVPGPWHVNTNYPFGRPGENVPIKRQDGVEVARALSAHDISHDEVLQNARLIAAAGTAAQEVRKMGYDPLVALKDLPKLIKALDQIRKSSDLPTHSLAKNIFENVLASAEGNDE